MLQRHRTLLITTILALATLLTSLLVQRQTAILPDVRAAAPRPTPPVVLPPGEVEPPVATPNASSPAQAAVVTPTQGPEVAPPAPPRAALIDQQRLFYEPDFYTVQIQAYLETQAGPLKNFRATIDDREYAFADILSSQAIYFSVNPKVLLALIEQQSGLITNPSPTEEQIRFMLGYHGEEDKYAGWTEQLRWARREIQKAQREFADAPDLVYADQSHSPLPPGLSLADYAITRVLAATTTPDVLPRKLDQGEGSFVATYTRLFGDPRAAPQNWPAPSAPFLALPMDKPHTITSFFDHEAPFLQPNGSIVTYRGDSSEQLSYDGHDGWDFAMMPPEPVLAAADGQVVFVGNAADGCATRSVVIDHGNGYRTLYWHLARWSVELGPIRQGEEIGIAGSSGCATGPHLHFGVQYLGRGTDPAGWCGQKNADLWANHPAGQTSQWLWRDVPSPCALPANAIVVDTSDPGFKRVGDGWQEAALGLGGTALYLPSSLPNASLLRIGVWRPELPKTGKYRVLVWIPYILSDLKDAGDLHYVVGHADGSGDTQQITVSQWDTGNWWADLGTYTFDPARNPFVGLSANDAEAGNNVWYDAIIWIPVE